jgi:hypothetical protein
MKTYFDPFKSRLCRDIRNDLSKSLVIAIHRRDIGPSYAVAEKYVSEGVEPFVTDYIHSRIMRYKTIVAQIQTENLQTHDTYLIAVLLWNQELFFEVHEWLEKIWHASEGTERFVSQALIRSAGAYMHLEYGRNTGAKKMASKAVLTLMHYKKSIPDIFNAALLISKLKALDPVPPKFGLPDAIKKSINSKKR